MRVIVFPRGLDGGGCPVRPFNAAQLKDRECEVGKGLEADLVFRDFPGRNEITRPFPKERLDNRIAHVTFIDQIGYESADLFRARRNF